MLGLSWKGIDCTELVHNSSSNRHFLVALGIWFLPFFYTRNGDISNLTVDGDRNANQKNLQPPKVARQILLGNYFCSGALHVVLTRSSEDC
jgi:hypothetical protein